MSFDPNKPYNELPLLPPGPNNFEKLSIYKKLGSAKAALAELKGRAPVIPNQKMLINTLVLQEAKDSSTIENIFTTDDELYKAFSAPVTITNPATKEVLRYREAVWSGFEKLQEDKKISLDLLIMLYRIIKETTGGVREIDVRIGNKTTTIYTPPEHGTFLNQKINNWLDFINADNGIDSLIKLAILHYQFECIHPFSDGNGRTGRIINALYLTNKELMDLPILYLSNYILSNKPRYYSLFTEVTKNQNWEDWILFMLDAIEKTSVLTLNKVNAIYSLFNETLERVKTDASDIYSYELVEILFHQPYCKIAFLVDSNIASRNTAGKYLSNLEELGILRMEKSGKENLYLNVKLYDLLTAA
jgi:Fic family protein